MLKVRKKSIVLLHGQFGEEALNSLPKGKKVYMLEGRPSLESASYLSKELGKRKITPTIIADNMAGFLFYKGLVDEVWLAASDLNKESAVCPVGSLILAVLAKKHKVKVKCHQGNRIKKYLGKQKDLVEFKGKRIAANGVKGYVPLVDTVPRKYFN